MALIYLRYYFVGGNWANVALSGFDLLAKLRMKLLCSNTRLPLEQEILFSMFM